MKFLELNPFFSKKERQKYEVIHSPLHLLQNEPWLKGKEVESQ